MILLFVTSVLVYAAYWSFTLGILGLTINIGFAIYCALWFCGAIYFAKFLSGRVDWSTFVIASGLLIVASAFLLFVPASKPSETWIGYGERVWTHRGLTSKGLREFSTDQFKWFIINAITFGLWMFSRNALHLLNTKIRDQDDI